MSKVPPPPGGYLLIGQTEDGLEIVMNLDHDRNGIGHIIFSPGQARHLARLLYKKAKEVDENIRKSRKDHHAH